MVTPGPSLASKPSSSSTSRFTLRVFHFVSSIVFFNTSSSELGRSSPMVSNRGLCEALQLLRRDVVNPQRVR
jgi:hypothetical protein